MNEWDLVAAYGRGDEEAFETLVRTYFPLVYGAALRQLGDPHLGQDVAQSVFIIFARKAAGLRREVLLSGWFLRTTSFVVRDFRKQMNRQARKEQEAAVAAQLSETVEREPGWVEAVPVLDEALLSLSTAEQNCILARFFEGRSFREIAEGQRISEDAAQKRVARGLERMKRFLERRGMRAAAMALPAVLTTEVAQSAQVTVTQSGLEVIRAALQGKSSGAASALLAQQFLKQAAWRQLVRLTVSVAAGLGAVGIGVWLLGSSAMRFKVSDARIEPLGRAWAVVVQRAAFMAQFPAGGPPAGNPNRAAYDQAMAFVLAESTRISTDFGRALQNGRERELVVEFLTVELRETLGLNARQQEKVYAQLHAPMFQTPNFTNSLRALLQSKQMFGLRLRQQLSTEQRGRLDRTYGTNEIGLLVFPRLLLPNG